MLVEFTPLSLVLQRLELRMKCPAVLSVLADGSARALDCDLGERGVEPGWG